MIQHHYVDYLLKHGGMATCGDGLGVFVAPAKYITSCPTGWTFVSMEDATTEIILDALNHTKQGRQTWP